MKLDTKTKARLAGVAALTTATEQPLIGAAQDVVTAMSTAERSGPRAAAEAYGKRRARRLVHTSNRGRCSRPRVNGGIEREAKTTKEARTT